MDTLPVELRNVQNWPKWAKAASEARRRHNYKTAQRIWRTLALDAMRAFVATIEAMENE